MSLKDMLARANLPSTDETAASLREEFDLLVKALGAPGINEDFRSDVLKIVTAAVDLARTVSKPNYPIDDILNNLAFLSFKLSAMLQHAANGRPRTFGHGISNTERGQIFPNFFLRGSEAAQYLENMKTLGTVPDTVQVIPIEITSTSVVRPMQPTPQAVPAVDTKGAEPPKQDFTSLDKILAPKANALGPLNVGTPNDSTTTESKPKPE